VKKLVFLVFSIIFFMLWNRIKNYLGMLILAVFDFLTLTLTFNIAILVRIKILPIFSDNIPPFHYNHSKILMDIASIYGAIPL